MIFLGHRINQAYWLALRIFMASRAGIDVHVLLGFCEIKPLKFPIFISFFYVSNSLFGTYHDNFNLWNPFFRKCPFPSNTQQHSAS